MFIRFQKEVSDFINGSFSVIYRGGETFFYSTNVFREVPEPGVFFMLNKDDVPREVLEQINHLAPQKSPSYFSLLEFLVAQADDAADGRRKLSVEAEVLPARGYSYTQEKELRISIKRGYKTAHAAFVTFDSINSAISTVEEAKDVCAKMIISEMFNDGIHSKCSTIEIIERKTAEYHGLQKALHKRHKRQAEIIISVIIGTALLAGVIFFSYVCGLIK